MIAYLKGRVLFERENGVVLECGGVGYEVILPDAVAKAVPAHVDPEHRTLELFISYHVTANQLKPVLVGFLRQVEREFFERFITVDGLGPAKAIRAMTRPVHDIADAIERKDAAFLKRLPGLGERSAEKVIAALHGKMAKFALLREEPLGPAARHAAAPDEVLAVLVGQLGHRPAEARRMVDDAVRRNPQAATVEDLLAEVYRSQKELTTP
jgi:Holliday junction DNA helicase RuvA